LRHLIAVTGIAAGVVSGQLSILSRQFPNFPVMHHEVD
jgi:hypothetical protein